MSFAHAATTMGVEKDLSSGSVCFDLFAQDQISTELGWFSYFLVTDGWSEAYVGPTYSPNPNLQIGLGYGLEQADDPGRFGGYVWAGKGKFSATWLFEDGGTGPWHRLNLGYQIDPRWRVVLSDRSFYGKGVSVEYQLDKQVKLQLNAWEEALTVKTCLDF